MECASEPDGLAAGAGALPGARRRCEAGKRTHGPGTRACLALLAAAALLALAAPAQAQTEIWSATLTPQNVGSGALGCNNTAINTAVACSNTAVLSDNDFTLGSTDHVIGLLELSAEGSLQIISTGVFTDADTLALVLGTTSLAFSDGLLGSGDGQLWLSTGISWTAGTDVSVRLISLTLTTPGVPTGLAATANGPSQIDLAWTAPASTGGSAITGYKIEVSPDGSSWSDLVADTASPDTAYAHMGLDPATTYHYRVSAINAVGTSDASDSDDTTTAATNTAAMGAPTITGTAEVGETLTASTTGIADANGLTTPGYTYQWIRVNGTEADIAGENSITYTLVDADLGTTLKVRVSFTDDASNSETLTSAATATVGAGNTAATGAPTITGTAEVGETLTASTTGIADANGLTTPGYTYQWIRVNGTEADIAGENSITYTLVDADLGTTLKVRVSFTDDASNSETLTSAATAAVSAAANTLATGAPTITGTAQVGQPLTAGTTAIMDADGLTSVSYTYQWIRVATDNTETNISSATASTYTLVAADQGTTVKVTVSFTDDANNPETLTSAATATVSAAANTLATGAPTITGTAQVGQPLTAGTTAIMDADGLTSVSYTYQWIRVATDNTETNISSATASTYMLVAADQGTTVKVTVSFTDDANNPETLTSAATAAVSAAANTLATGAPTITGTAQVGQPLTAGTTAIMDADGLTSVSYTYQWIGVATDNTETNISSATASTYTLVAADQGTTIKVTVSFTDDASNAETRTSAATAAVAAAPNTPATGAPTITGTAQVGQTLTAATTGITDADGLTSPTYTYQWIRVDGTDEADIAAANSSTYILGAADLGTTLTVRVTFADDLGHTETLTSAATATVGAGAVATAPTVTDVAVTSTPASGTTYYLADEVIEFTVTFSAPVTVTGTPTFAFRLGAATRQAAYARGSDSAALVFARTVQAGEVDRNGISWNAIALALDGGTITQTGATTAARLTHAAQASLEGHRVDAAPPMQVSASVQGLALVLVYDEPLDPASMPATGAYTVTATGGATTTTPAVSEVSIYGIWVTLTLDAAPAAGATVTLAYAPPASNPVQDEAGNDAPAFSGQSVRLGQPPPDLAQVLGVGVAPGNAQLVVTWTAVDTATGYTVQWMSGSQGYNAGDRQATVTSGSTTRYTIPSLINGTAYTVRVSATRTGVTDGPPSAEMTGTPRVPPPPPPPVTDLAQVLGVGVAPGNAQLVVTWTAVDTATGYTVQWKSGGQGYNTGDRQATVTPGSTTSHTIEGLANGTEYTVRVIATRTDANDGPPSAEVTGTTEMIPVPTPTLPEIALLLLAMLLLGSGVYLLRGRQSGGLTHA